LNVNPVQTSNGASAILTSTGYPVVVVVVVDEEDDVVLVVLLVVDVLLVVVVVHTGVQQGP
jgi:hypothetical protein